VEALKNRRRLIGWPRALNAAERRILRGPRTRHIVVPFARAAIAAGRVNMTFYAIADFVKFFQQFAIDAAVRHFYSFTLDGELLCLTTVPTGGVGPPLLAEALTRAICAAAVRLLGHQDINSVIYDTMIDNVRFVADSAELIVRVWHNFVDICGGWA
jgi:hypothetical protein